MNSHLLLTGSTPVPARVSHLQLLYRHSEHAVPVIMDEDFHAAECSFRVRPHAGVHVPTATPPLLTGPAGKSMMQYKVLLAKTVISACCINSTLCI